ncbi:MAG TPA: VOC family protein [Candidatus Methylacidiphilales bacterium]
MQLNPSLLFDGNCDEAFKFYAKALGGKILFRITYGESPMAKETSKELLDKVMHIRLEASGNILMGSDAPCDRYSKPQGFFVTLGVETPEEAERIFNALSEKGTVGMPLQETFWAQRFAMFVDQFGTPWMINCEKKP